MLDWFKSVLYRGLGPMIAFFAAALNPLVAIVLIVFQLLQLVADFTDQMVEQYGSVHAAYMALMNYVGDSIWGRFPPQISAAFGFINAWVPLTEMFILVGLACALYVLTVAVRMLKSLIPGLN